MKNFIQAFIVISIVCLASCDSSTEPPPLSDTITQTDLEAASLSQVVFILNPNNHQLSLWWIDRFADEAGFGVEKYVNEAWSRVSTLEPVEATGQILTWSTIMSESGQYRVVAVKTDYLVPLQSPSGESQFNVVLPTLTPVLLLDADEPISDEVIVSISNPGGITSVEYYIDLTHEATITEGEGFPHPWNPTNLPTGVYLLSAMAHISPGVFWDLRRQVSVANPSGLAINMSISGTSGVVDLDVTASADIGIESVESFLDGTSLGLLTGPNHETLFRWSVDTETFGPGDHTIRTVAISRDGNSAEKTMTTFFNQFPVLMVDSPQSGTIVSGDLPVSGSFSDDTEGTTISGRFNDVSIFSTSESPFSYNTSIILVTPGVYTLTVTAVDEFGLITTVSREVVVEAGSAMEGTLVASNVTLMDAEAGWVLYQKPDDSILMRSSGGTEYLLPDTESIQHANDWQLFNGRVLVYGRLGSYPNPYQIILYEPGAELRNLSAEAPASQHYDTHPVSEWPWVAWGSQDVDSPDTYWLMNLQTNEFFEAAMPPDVTSLGNFKYDLALLSQDTRFFYWGKIVDEWDIYYFSTATQTSTRVTTNGGNIYVQSDGERVAWQRASDILMVASAETPDMASALSNNWISYFLEDGVLAWRESDGISTTIYADDGVQTTLSLYDSSSLVAAGGGYVAFLELGKLMVWDRQNGSRVVLNTPSRKVVIDGDHLYVETSGNSIYVFDLQ